MAVIQIRTVRALQRCDASNRKTGSQEALFGAGSCLTGRTTAIDATGLDPVQRCPGPGRQARARGVSPARADNPPTQDQEARGSGQRWSAARRRLWGERRARSAQATRPALSYHDDNATGDGVPRRRVSVCQARDRFACQLCRSTSIFLISAIARAGLRSFGHTSVQFMMVWQR